MRSLADLSGRRDAESAPVNAPAMSVRLLELMRSVVEVKGDSIFSTWLGDKGDITDYSYRTIWERAGAISHMLIHKLKVRKGDRVMLCYGFGLEFFIAFLACLRAGAISVPVYPPNPSKLKMSLEKLCLIIHSSGASICLTDKQVNSFRKISSLKLLSSARWPSNVRWVVTEGVAAGGARSYDNPELQEGDVAFLQYSSGSTGDPKGVMVTFGNLDHNINRVMLPGVRQYVSHNRGSEDQEAVVYHSGVSWLPQYHDMGLIVGLLVPFVGGWRMYHMSPMHFLRDPLVWVRTISKYGCFFSSAPSFALGLTARRWKALKVEELLDMSSLQLLQLGGEPVNPEHVSSFHDAFTPHGLRSAWVYPAYGLAEHTVAVCFALELRYCKNYERQLVACGSVYEVDIRIVNSDTLAECAEGEPGEIWVSSESCAVGYWCRPEASQETFGATMSTPDRPPDKGNGRYLRTGDMGFLEEGCLYICGRIKDLIILRGRNIYPQDIEVIVERACDSVRPGCVAAFSSVVEGLEEEQVEVVFEWRQTKGKASSSKEVMEAELYKVFEAVMGEEGIRLHRIVAIAERTIPKTTSGKIRRRQTRDDLHGGTLKIVHELKVAATQEAIWDERARTGGNTDGGAPLRRAAAEALRDGGPLLLAETLEQLREALLEPLQAVVMEVALEVTGLQSLGADTPLMGLGLESIMSIQFRERLSHKLGGLNLPATLLFDYPTIRLVTAFVMREIMGASASRGIVQGLEEPSDAREPLAVVGMACRFPGGVDGGDLYWKLLTEGVDAVTEVPKDRWDVDEYYDPDPEAVGKMYTRYGAFIDGIDLFDAKFFGISAAEATAMDPQQRLLMEVSYCALVNAGYSKETLLGKNAGVFVGACGTDFSRIPQDRVGPYSATGTSHSILSNRLSFAMGLKGPSVTVDTACSSSLVAVDMASRVMRAGDCSLAVVAGVNLILIPQTYVAVCQGRMLAPDGRCKTFDASADGYVRGEGCAAIVLRWASDAKEQGIRILSMVRGTAVNQDGRSATLTAPNGPSQEEVVRAALIDGRISPAEMDYIEAHGTGTALGDPIEVGALKSVFAPGREVAQPLVVGSVKTQIGHLEGAAGIAGLIKAVLVLHHRIAPLLLHFKSLNPSIKDNIEGFPIVFPTHNLTLGGNKDGDEALVAGVSSFGFGGACCGSRRLRCSGPAACR